jgi:membrane protein
MEQSEAKSDQQASGLKGKLISTKERLEQYPAFRVLESTARGFTKDRVTSSAAAMTYYGIFSLFPLLLLFMSLAGLALQSNEAAREQIMQVIVGLLPQGQEQLKDVIAGVIDAKGAAAGIGILTLLWGALGWFQVIDNMVNQIWGVNKTRSFLKGKLFALAMVAAIGGVALLSWLASAAVSILGAFTDLIPGSVVLWQALVSALSVLTIAGAFFVLYRFTPRRQVERGDIWPAALITALLWEGTRRLLAFYLEQNNMISGYGPIGAAMALLFWIYVASNIILLGAELAYAIAKERRQISPAEEMQVVAPPGEQPTPKFAPQVGQGFENADQKEPIYPAPNTADLPANPLNGQPGVLSPTGGQNGRTNGAGAGLGHPSQDGSLTNQGPGIVKTLLWTGLTAGATAATGLVARRVTSGVWEKFMHEPPPTSKV